MQINIASKPRLIVVFMATIALFNGRSASADGLTNDSRQALKQLTAQNSAAKVLSKAQAVLVFPRVVKAGFMVGAQTGKGVLLIKNQPSGRYRTVAASYGFQ